VDGFQQLTQNAAPRPPDHAGEEGRHDDGQRHAQADPQGDDEGARRVAGQDHAGRRRQAHGGHGDEVQPGDAAGGQGGRCGQLLPAAEGRQEDDRAEQDQPARDGQADARRIPRQHRAGQAHGVHADEVHGRDAGCDGDCGDQPPSTPQLRIRRADQVQLHSDPEGGRHDHQRQEGLQGVVTDLDAYVVGQHGDEMGGPYAQSADQGRGQGVGAACSGRQASRTLGQQQGDAEAENAGQDGESGDSPVVAFNQTAQNTVQHDAPSAPKPFRRKSVKKPSYTSRASNRPTQRAADGPT